MRRFPVQPSREQTFLQDSTACSDAIAGDLNTQSTDEH